MRESLLAEKITIGIDLGMTVSVRGTDWLKPAVHASIQFDDIPDTETLNERWTYLWEEQIGPQSDELLSLLMEQMTKRLGPYKAEEPSKPADVQSTQDVAPRESSQAPDGEAYS